MASQIPFNGTAPVFTPVFGPPLLVSSNDTYSDANAYAACVYFVPALLFIFIAILIKIALNRKRFKARNAAALRQTRAHQNQLSTVSRSVDANIVNSTSNGPSSSRRGSDETLKIDLPPTYEEVMRNFLNAKEPTATTSTTGIAAETTNTHEIVEVEIETIPTCQQRNLH